MGWHAHPTPQTADVSTDRDAFRGWIDHRSGEFCRPQRRRENLISMQPGLGKKCE